MQWFTEGRFHVRTLMDKHQITRRQAGRICKQVCVDINRRLLFSKAAKHHDELYSRHVELRAKGLEDLALIAETNEAYRIAVGNFDAQCDERVVTLKRKLAYRSDRAWSRVG